MLVLVKLLSGVPLAAFLLLLTALGVVLFLGGRLSAGRALELCGVISLLTGLCVLAYAAALITALAALL